MPGRKRFRLSRRKRRGELLPQRLREKIGLDDRAFFMAQGDYLKVSTPETHDADLAAIEAEMPALEPGADPLSLLPPAPPADA